MSWIDIVEDLLEDEGPLPAHEITRRLKLDDRTTQRALQRLLAAGCVVRTVLGTGDVLWSLSDKHGSPHRVWKKVGQWRADHVLTSRSMLPWFRSGNK